MNKVFSVAIDLSNEIRNSKFETVTRDIGGNVVDVTVFNNRNTTDLTGNTISIIYMNSKSEMYLENTLLTSDLSNGKFSFIIPQDALYLAGNVTAEIFIENATETVTSQQFQFNVRQGIGDGGGFVPIPDIPNWIDATESLQAQIDAIVTGGTESDPRVSQALVDGNNVTWPTLKARMDNSDSKIGDTTTLQTDDKTSVVNAINEHEVQINETAADLAQTTTDLTNHIADLVTDVDGVHGIKAESGIFTPTISGSVESGTPVYSLQAGKYYRIGNMVSCNILLGITSKGGLSGVILIGGLPFVAASDSFKRYSASIGSFENMSGLGSQKQIGGYLVGTQNIIYLTRSFYNAAATQIVDAEIDDSLIVQISITYETV